MREHQHSRHGNPVDLGAHDGIFGGTIGFREFLSQQQQEQLGSCKNPASSLPVRLVLPMPFLY